MKTAIIISSAAILFLLLDLLWFSFAGNFFKGEIGSIARLTADGAWNVRYIPALLVYALMAIGLCVFVLPHATSVLGAFVLGALFGLIGYGLYDLTNLATLSTWTVRFVVVDMAWGTLLCGTVSAVLHAVFGKLS
jgi:uncharacterized membrane protein